MFSSKGNRAEIAIDKISVNPDQPRKVFEEKELEELRDSIAEFGVIQPVLVRRAENDGYLLIAGERRLRAAAMAGLKKIPAIVREADGRDMALIALTENVQRENLNYIEEAAAYKRLMDEYGLTQGEIARRMGKQQSTISNKMRLLALPVEIQALLAKYQLSERHARALLKLQDNKQRKMILEKIAGHNLNVKQSEKLIDDFLAKKAEEGRRAEKMRCINYKIYINTLKKAFHVIQDAEESARYYQEDKGDYYEVRITIPKKAG